MHKNILTVVGITILFLGLAIQPSVATVQPNKIIVEPNVDDIEGLVAQLRIVINEILQEYGYNPMVAYLCNYILGILDGSYSRAVCILLIFVMIPIEALLLLLAAIFSIGIIRNYYIFLNFLALGFVIAGIWDINCAHYFSSKSIQPLRIISTLTETNDISNLENDCPCMQE